MNNTLLQHSYGLEYPYSTESKYLPRDRSFAATNLPTNEYLERRNDLVNSSLGPSLNLSGAGANLDYVASSVGLDVPYNGNAQHLVLTPPQSLDGSAPTTNPSSSSFQFSSVARGPSRNLPGSEQYLKPASTYLQPTQNWNTSSMTTDALRRSSQMALPASPPHSYGHSGSHVFGMSKAMESYTSMKPIFPSWPNRELVPPRNTTIGPPPSPWSHSMQQNARLLEGPPFEDTIIVQTLFNTRNAIVHPEITASIPKGFFRVENKWTCYRRNYFTVSCAFMLNNHAPDQPVYLRRHAQAEMIQSFAVMISAKTAAGGNQESEIRGLVQHTPKRSKDTESIPGRVQLAPTVHQPLVSSSSLLHSGLYTSPLPLSTGLMTGFDSYSASSQQLMPCSHMFERIQFQKATANNGKRRAQQQYFHIIVELQANVAAPGRADDWVVIATKQSQPMVVRGRSPGHYKDGRRESTASMDPDNGSGGGGDGPSSGYNMQGLNIGHPHSGTVNWNSGHRDEQYLNHYSRLPVVSDSSSTSAKSPTPLTASPTDEAFDGANGHMHTFTHSPTSVSGRSGYGGHRISAYRPGIQNNGSGCDSNTVYASSLDMDYVNPSFTFSETRCPETLCASS